MSDATELSDSTSTTRWTHKVTTPLRDFLSTEAGSAGVLVAAIVAALLWANTADGSYESFWSTELSIRFGGEGIELGLREWVNSGLMTLFFLVVGLEARREFDLGDLRDRRRFVLPALAGIAGMMLPIGIYLAFTHGGPGVAGWGAAMSTDTALALGLLALVGRNVPVQARLFLVTVSVVDDVVALIVIGAAYTEDFRLAPLLLALAVYAFTLVLVRLGVRSGFIYLPFCLVIWGAMLHSGVDPVVSGLAIGLAAAAYTPARGELEQASDLFRSFREQPTPELARFARIGVLRSLSPNDRLTRTWSGVSSYLIVPLFGLANAGIEIHGDFLGEAIMSPVTVGVFLAYVVGKPVAITGVSALVTWMSGGRIRPGAGWASVLGTGTIAGMGFTVSFLIANLALDEPYLSEVKLGLLLAIVGASLVTWTVFFVTSRLPKPRKAVALLGDVEELTDLIPDVDPDRDHVRGPADASVTLVEYGDFQCPYCGRAEPVVRELLTDDDLRYVWRHLPLTDVHPQAQLAAQAAEAAGLQGRFWEMHDLMFTRQDHLRIADLIAYAGQLNLDQDRFHDDMMKPPCKEHITADLESADLSGVSGTPTFFINGRRHYGAYDVATLKEAIRVARVRAKIAAKRR
ncbi:Na+/H+ antiporter NhaA [Actinoplanes sp. LDG1-06]|uniref:Na(+)/H(+) antiporter NhaA n=1 Tax=Paractinoplanes ovalisporus TaxID=2810368 RepID=A0ABS2A9H5_9ACTN|nr:Na+/H+ antiporter NhaA [Actinoplanes ovalisporus]MBM2616485.1 Na+/H+ antiporter NhaA [Actinoplanes ovalisporus]